MIGVLIHPPNADNTTIRNILQQSGGIKIVEDSTSPDVVILLVHKWNQTGYLEFQPFLNRIRKPALVVCEMLEEPFASESILRRQVHGVLRLKTASQQLLPALYASVAGLRVLPVITPNGTDSQAVFTTLTPRELEILTLIADGEGNKSIAYLLEISEHTVKFHISSIFEKLHVASRTEAVKTGLARGLISI